MAKRAGKQAQKEQRQATQASNDNTYKRTVRFSLASIAVALLSTLVALVAAAAINGSTLPLTIQQHDAAMTHKNQDILHIREKDLTAPDFQARFVGANTPVVITHSSQYSKASNADKLVNMDAFAVDHGDARVKLSMSLSSTFERVEGISASGNSFWHSWLNNNGNNISDMDRDSKNDAGNQADIMSSRQDMSGYTPCTSVGGQTRSEQSESCTMFTLDRVVVRPTTSMSTVRQVLEIASRSYSSSSSSSSQQQQQANSQQQQQQQQQQEHLYVEYESVPQSLRKQLEWWAPESLFASSLAGRQDFFGFWMGVGNTTAHLHFDANENLFMQLVGTRTWTLFPPAQGNLLYESYMLETTEAGLDGNSNDINLSYFTSPVDWQNHDYNRFPLLKKAEPLRVVLEPGEVLYVPSYWWHQVEASPGWKMHSGGGGGGGGGGEGSTVTVGINKWFDPAFVKVAPCADCKMFPNRKSYPAETFETNPL